MLGNKVQKVVSLLGGEEISKALKMVSGMSNEELKILQIAQDIMLGRTKYYESLGINCEVLLEKAEQIIKEKISNQSNQHYNNDDTRN